MTAENFANAAAYVRRIKNAQKRAYGVAYLAWKRDESATEPSYGVGLSYMGAQSVRLSIRELLNPPVPNPDPPTANDIAWSKFEGGVGG